MTARREPPPRADADAGGEPDDGAGAGARAAAPWRPLTRRAFVAAIGAATAAVVVRNRVALLGGGEPDPDDRPRSTWNGHTRWIGHC
jgi:hypothetical protein